MNSNRSTDRTSRVGGGSISATPSIALLNRRLGASPAPRMLTRYEIDLLRQCAKEASKVAGEILASNAVIVFDEPVRGPVLLGAGRFRGYGLRRPIGAS